MPVHGNGNFPRMVPAPPTSYREPVESANGIMTNRPALKGNARIAEYRVLKGLPRADVALERLRNIGAIVKPIMVRHGWQLPLLVEFSGFQKNGPELLGMNVNHGQKILLRLRTPLYGTHSGPNNFPTMSDSFLAEDDVVYTMLHELTHNVHGPHDDKFFKFLKELEEEWFEMRRSGGRLPGDGWHTPGYRVGMGMVRDLPPAEARRKAAAMAEERRRKGLLGVGGGRLGGGPDSGGSTPLTPQRQQELAAEAAERRRRHDKDSAAVGGGVCPSTQSAREEAVKWHEEEQLLHGIKVITIEDDSDDEAEYGQQQKKSPAAETSTSKSAYRSESSTPKLEASSSSKAGGGANATSRDGGPSNGNNSIKKEPPAKDTSAIVIDSDTEDEDGDEDFSTISVKRVKRQPTAPATTTHKGKAPTKPAAPLVGGQGGPSSSLSNGPSLAARTALAAMKKTATTGANAGANTAGWRCGICRQWMGGEKASLWVCVKCGALARK